MRLVLIEDHDLARAGMRITLQKAGFDVVAEAGSGKQGLRAVVQHQPDIALVDIGLPDIDGVEVTKQIKADFPHIRVVILTMQDMGETVLAAFAAGADSYCMKNISREKLELALTSTYEGVSWLDPAIASKVLNQLKSTSNGVSIEAEKKENIEHLDAFPLSHRELEVLELIVKGYTNLMISEALYITVGTVKTHVRSILGKLCVDDRAQAAVRALRAGLVR
jgi:DNA-binding NarL/FixJ family response regulator